MTELMIGTSAFADADDALMRRAGIGWVRQGFPAPFSDGLDAPPSDAYLTARRSAEGWAGRGMKVMAITPLPFGARYEPDSDGNLRLRSRRLLPEWIGDPETSDYYDNYAAICRFLAEDLRGVVSAWQIANELDLEHFSGPLRPRQACGLIETAARAVKEVDPSAPVGHNPSGQPTSYYMWGRLFGRPDTVLDYCGVDAYYGTWQPGAPGDWAERIAELYELTGAPVLVNEWGYASRGDVMAEGELAPDLPPCQVQKWRFGWSGGHDAQTQARFVRSAFEAFRSQRDKLLGAFFYRWEDQQTCWQCKQDGCPMETAWGLVNLDGTPKPALDAHGEGVQMLLSR